MAELKCNKKTVQFVIKKDDPQAAIIEDDIRNDLKKIGVTVQTVTLDSDAYTDAEKKGTYNLLLSKTWGAPYDPHSYLESWQVPSHVEYSAINGLRPPLTREQLFTKIDQVQAQESSNTKEIQDRYGEILNDIHRQAIFLPLYGVRTPYVLNRRFSGFVPSEQTYAYPISTVRVDSGSPNINIAIGTGGSLFKSVGPIHPHLYSPNQLFSQHWVYEGLLTYRKNGEVGPGLAEKWDQEKFQGGQRVTFTLRKAKFHDGTDFNCTAAKLNFDHVLSDVVRKRHAWYGTPQVLTKWYCNDAGQFILETDKAYYPLLQELTYIRPLTFAAPSAFHKGIDSSPDEHNSCNPGGFGTKWEELEKEINFKGLSKPIGTGPFKYVEKKSNNGIDEEVTFAYHEDYWGTAPEIKEVKVKYYEKTSAVKADLISGKLDMALGIGPLPLADVRDLKYQNSDVVQVFYSDVQQHAAIIMNTGKEPTNDYEFRTAVIHSVDKNAFIQKDFAGLERSVSSLLPRTAPYCDVDLNPKWNYDFEKASRINCPEGSKLSGGAIAGIAIGGLFLVALAAFIAFLIRRERKGKPIFAISTEEQAGFS